MATAMGTKTRPPDHRRRVPPPGLPPRPPGLSTSTSLNSGTPAWAKARSNRDRPYHQIISDSMSSSTNIILKISLVSTDPEKVHEHARLPVEDVLRLGFSTGRKNTKEILVKSSTDLSNITTEDPSPPHHMYKDHKITILTLDNKTTRVTSRSVF